MLEDRIKSLENKLDNVSLNMEKTKIAEYTELIENPKRLLLVNFLGGLARGFGMAIGFTVLAAIILYLIQQLVNLPLIGKYIAELINIIENYR